MSGSKLVVVVTGSIAAYKACEVVSGLVQLGHTVRVVASAAALKFVGNPTWEGLTGHPALGDLFQPGAALEHIQLSRWADLILVCPATANSLNRWAAGLSDDLAGALILARDPRKPLLVAPAMNPAMWHHPATVESVARLRAWGCQLLEVGAGRTACGELGLGRLAEPAVIIGAVSAALAHPPRRLRVLVTSGPTSEPIDQVRVLSNSSSGETGAGIAQYLHNRGHCVVLLRGRGSAGAAVGGGAEEFGSGAELASAVERHLTQASFDAVIHAAAVSDFRVESVEVAGNRFLPGESKIASTDQVILHLRGTPKLVDRLRAMSRKPDLCLVAFKLTAGASNEARERAVKELIAHSGADLVIHNDLDRRIPDGPFPAELFQSDGTTVARCADRAAIAPAIEAFLGAFVPQTSSYAPVS